ncbi:protein S100-A1 [Archocentrus centrarchus]|uniref:protein S100-A1 n=1 Tax=Archocentrus centrarchus TaxID=63155 RepID=UPI0011E9FA7A|nr:protein S100-A1-like [Archocentrus centrarchus]
MSSSLTQAMADLIVVFYKYSGNEGDKYTLTKSELKNLLQNEFGESMNAAHDISVVEGIMRELDDNKDGVVDFKEFVVLVTAVTIAANEFFLDWYKSNNE